jgi:hypothetical protein
VTISHFDQPPHVATVVIDGRRFDVTLRLGHDGIEYVGRLWFAEDSWDDGGIPDRAAFCGRTPEDALTLAMKLTPDELTVRYQRALSEKRRFRSLRKVTDEILAKIRYMNQLSISMRAGLLDIEGAAQEIEITEQHLHEIVGRLRDAAGVEDE